MMQFGVGQLKTRKALENTLVGVSAAAGYDETVLEQAKLRAREAWNALLADGERYISTLHLWNSQAQSSGSFAKPIC